MPTEIRIVIPDSSSREEKWDRRFLALAEFYAQWSKDPSTRVGALIIDPNTNRVISMGYNGFPRGVPDRPEWLADREMKLKHTIHAEENALLFAERSVEGLWLCSWPFPPCLLCTLKIIQARIARVFAPASNNPRWKDDFDRSQNLFSEVGIPLKLY